MSEVDGEEDWHATLLRHAEARDWTAVDEPEPEQHCEPDLTTVDALSGATKAKLLAELGMPERAIELAFEKLRALIARDQWRFVGGTFLGFESHHNDTEIHVVLERDG